MSDVSTNSSFPEVHPRTDPYVDWWALAEGSRTLNDGTLNALQIIPRATFGLRETAPGGRELPDFEVPLPENARNKKFREQDWTDWTAPKDDYPKIEKDDVIVGIIDTEFALGHRRFRFGDNSSRFLAAWIQGADWNEQKHLPFGREYSRRELNDKLQAYSGSKGGLDQERFNRELGLVDADEPSWRGYKALQQIVSHGTHVLDVASGREPGTAGANLKEGGRCHLIAVSLPPLFFHGHSGNFLQYHAVLGLIRILRIADAISAANIGPDHQFPVVVNFSFGFEAGPKDGSLELERAIRREIRRRARDLDPEEMDEDGTSCMPKEASRSGPPKTRKRSKRLPVKTFVAMPAGNSNLLRVSGRDRIVPENKVPFEVIVQPQDHSSTYLEFWSEVFTKSSSYFNGLKLKIGLPDGHPVEILLDEPKRDLQTKGIEVGGELIGRVYYQLSRPGLRAPDLVRLRIVVALAPTLVFFEMQRKPATQFPKVSLAPAGRWLFTLAGLTNALRFDAYVQADLSGGPLPQNARRAYFDHSLYRDFLEDGRVRDSFSCEDPTTSLDTGPIRRIGTHNALAATPYISMIGGYRASDGCPAAYSATGYVGPPDVNHRSDVDVMFPCEDGAARFGILGAGTRDGAVLALNGTSVATALCTREMTDALLQDPDTQVGQPWLQTRALAYAKSDEGPETRALAHAKNDKRPDYYKDAAPLKAGAGHLPFPESYLLHELGAGFGSRKPSS